MVVRLGLAARSATIFWSVGERVFKLILEYGAQYAIATFCELYRINDFLHIIVFRTSDISSIYNIYSLRLDTSREYLLLLNMRSPALLCHFGIIYR